jgi:hypothetical protein
MRITAPGTVVRRRIAKFALCAPRAGPGFQTSSTLVFKP